jgi:NADH-quinone oxidoreductase subunit G
MVLQQQVLINEKSIYIILKKYPILILICQLVFIDIPRFCYHDSLVIAGNCRMCLIDDNKTFKPIIACSTQVEDNDIFFTNTLKVTKARVGVLEFLLINHPLDCPICDQGGECDLQDISLVFGNDRGRFHEYKRSVTNKKFNFFIKTLMNRCIHCTRCIRFAIEFADLSSLGMVGRGSNMEIGSYLNILSSSMFFSNIIDLCPVGAFTAKSYSFLVRPWESLYFYTFDVLDVMLTPIKVLFKDNIILRILSCTNIYTLSSFSCD